MTDPAALTDEELAEWERQVHGESTAYVTVHLAPKLIAALRASRTQLAVLEARLASAERMRAASFDRAERLERAPSLLAATL